MIISNYELRFANNIVSDPEDFYWTDGAIIGSKAFVQEVGCMFDEQERILKKQLSCGSTPSGGVLHCFKRLREQA